MAAMTGRAEPALTVLEVAKSELRTLRMRDYLAVVLRGARGPKSSLVNGVYIPTIENVNGRPAYAKAGNAGNTGQCLYFTKGGKWMVANNEDRDSIFHDLVHFSGLACTVDSGLSHPSLASKWNVDDKRLSAQQLEVSIMVRLK